MKRILPSFVVVSFLVVFISSELFSQGQCLGGGCTGGYQYPSGTLSSNTNSWTAVSTVNWAGEYGVYNVTSGSTYEWSLLAADGGSVSYDAELTLINNSTLATICYSNDYSEVNKPKINWTATFTGTVRVLITQFSCATNSTNTTLVWRCSSCGSGSAPANDNCSGAIALTPGATCTPTTGNVSGATQSLSSILCNGFTGDANDDVWYKFTATSALHTITVAGSASFDPVVDVRSGACNGANINCADATGSGGTEVINLAGLSIGTTYYVRVYDYGSGTPVTTTFTICVTTPSSCSPYYSTGTSAGDFINRVQLGTIDNTPAGTGSAGGPYYNDYYATVGTSLQAGTNQNITVTVGTYGGQTVAAWIDYNNNGSFLDAGEKLGEVANIAASTAGSINFTIPAGATVGNTRMRVRTVWSTTGLDPCATYSYGEAEDYKITITNIGCTTPGTPVSLSTTAITTTQAQLNWAAGAPVGSPTVTYYWAIGAASNVTYEANYLFRGTTASLNAVQALLTPGTTYYWTVKAVTSCNGSASAYPAAIAFVSSCITPSAPTALNTTNISTTSATLNWTASASGSPTISYYWAIGTLNTVTYEANYVQRGIVSGTTVNVFTLTPGTTYYWTVKAYTSCNGTVSAYPAAINFITTNIGGNKTWVGGTSTDWFTASNWNPAGVPDYTHDIIIPASCTNYPIIITGGIDATAANCGGLSINNSSYTNALTAKCKSLLIQSGGKVTVNRTSITPNLYHQIIVNGNLIIEGTLNHQCGSNSNWFIINSGGVVRVKNGAYLNVGSSAIAAGVPSGTINSANDIDLNGGTLQIDPGAKVFIEDNLRVAQGGLGGTLSMTGGDLYIVYYGSGSVGSMGFVTSSTSTINISGGNIYLCGQEATGKMVDWNASASYNISGGTINLINGTTVNNAGYCNFGGKAINNLTINRPSASSYLITNNAVVNGDITITAGTFNAGGLNITAAGNWTNNGTFTSGAGTVLFTGSSDNINGTSITAFNNLTLANGASYTLNPTGAADRMQVNGTYNGLSGSSLAIASGSILDLYGSTITFDGITTAVGANNTGIPATGNGREIDINNSATLSGGGTTQGDMRIFGGTTTLASNFVLSGNFEINTGATFIMSTQNFSVSGSWITGGAFNAGTGTVNFTGSASSIIDANGYYNGLDKVTADFYNVTVNRTADTISMKNTPMKITHDFTLTQGIFSTGWKTQPTGLSGQNRRLTVVGFATIGAGTTFFVGYRRACSNSSEALTSCPFSGCTPCLSTCPDFCNADSLNVPVFKGDFYNYGNVRTNRPVGSAFQDIKLAGARIAGTGVANEFGVDFQIETNMSATQVGPVDIQGDLIVQDNTSFINTNPNNVLTVRGNFYMYYNLTHNGTVNCYRDFTSGSTAFHTPNTVSINNSIFNFYQTGALRHIFLKTTAANPIYNFGDLNIIAGAGNVRQLRQRISVSGNLVIQSGTLDAINSGVTSAGGSISPAVGVNDASIFLSGNTSSWTNNGIFTPRSDTVSFTGSAAQTMGGNNATTFYNLTVNKAGGSEVSFANIGTVTNLLTLTNGYVVTDAAKLLILTDLADDSPHGGSAISFVRGPIKKIGQSVGEGSPYTFLFPIGKNSVWGRLYMVHFSGIPATTDAFTAEYFDAGFGNYAVNAPLNHVSTIEYWNLSKNSGDVSLNKRLRLFSEDNTRSVITAFNNADLTVAHWNGAKWDDIGYNPNSSNSGAALPAGWISSNNTANFSPFTFASRSAVNPLPVELLSFTAKLNGSVVDLFWSTASEFNNDHFTVERSKDMTNFVPVATVQGAGNSTTVLNYKTTDKEPWMGVSYYRLKQTDFDGNFTYSAIVPITISEFAQPNSNEAEHVLVYPNPSTGEVNVNFTCKEKGVYLFSVYDMMGNKMYSTEKTIEAGETLLTIDLHELPSGVYFLNLETQGKRFSEKLIIQK